MKVLVVDDTTDSADMLGFMVRMAGHEVAVVYDAYTAIDTARSWLPDVVFMDIGMPDVDGYELARRLRALPELAQTHLVATTGFGADDDKQRGREAGFQEYLVKPIDVDQVEGLLERVAGSRAAG